MADRPVGRAGSSVPDEGRFVGIAAAAKSRQSLQYLTFNRFAFGVPVGAAALVVLAVLACGPSVQLVYEGNMRFEHCYRLDFDEQIAPSHRRACWAEWVDNYAMGQTRDRLEYAKRRVEAMDRGEGGALSMHLGDPADAGPPATLAQPVPVPTSAHAPPPPVSPAAVPSSSANSTASDAGVVNPPADDTTPDAGADQGKTKGKAKSAPARGRGRKTKS